jgi:hypothetical protein
MLNPKILTITDDSGILAIVNADKYNSFVSEEWELPQILKRFVDEMNNDNLIIWSTGFKSTWTVNFLSQPSDKKSFREFSKTIAVTDGQLFLTNYEDLTMSAQYEDEKIPAKHNADLFVKVDNGTYDFKIRQLFDPTDYERRPRDTDFEIIVQLNTKATDQNVHEVFWRIE